jgi:hypothetical protein
MNPPCNKIKVIHVITRFDKGGSAENTFITVRDLDKARYEVVLIKGTAPPGNSGDLETEAVQANVNIARGHHVRLICHRHLVRELRPFWQPFSPCFGSFGAKSPISSIPTPQKRASWADGRRGSAASPSSSTPRTVTSSGGTSTRGKPACLSY